MNNLKDPFGNRTCDPEVHSAVPQPELHKNKTSNPDLLVTIMRTLAYRKGISSVKLMLFEILKKLLDF
jgi:hypothetical protein